MLCTYLLSSQFRSNILDGSSCIRTVRGVEGFFEHWRRDGTAHSPALFATRWEQTDVHRLDVNEDLQDRRREDPLPCQTNDKSWTGLEKEVAASLRVQYRIYRCIERDPRGRSSRNYSPGAITTAGNDSIQRSGPVTVRKCWPRSLDKVCVLDWLVTATGYASRTRVRNERLGGVAWRLQTIHSICTRVVRERPSHQTVQSGPPTREGT